MAETTYEAIERLLASVQEEVDDSEVSYKLRTARQLIKLSKDRTELYEEALEDAELDSEAIERLHQLGYL